MIPADAMDAMADTETRAVVNSLIPNKIQKFIALEFLNEKD
jgi:hypothetical protein